MLLTLPRGVPPAGLLQGAWCLWTLGLPSYAQQCLPELCQALELSTSLFRLCSLCLTWKSPLDTVV